MKKLFDRLFTLMGILFLLLAITVGAASAWLLGSVLGMGFEGYCLGFVGGVAIVFSPFFFDVF